MTKLNNKKLFIDLVSILNKKERDYIYSSLNIENHSKNSLTKFKVWFDHFKKHHNQLDGDIFEFGVYKGNSLLSMAILMKRLNSKKKIYGFDSFSGFPGYSKYDNFDQFFLNKEIFDKKFLHEVKLFQQIIKINKKKTSPNKISTSNDFSNTSFKDLKHKIEFFKLDNIELIKGDFSKTVPKFFKKFSGSVFSANIDCDLYMGYKIVLPYLWEKLSRKGMIYLDEYYSLKFPGPKIACNEFFRQKKIESLKIIKSKGQFDRCYLFKN